MSSIKVLLFLVSVLTMLSFTSCRNNPSKTETVTDNTEQPGTMAGENALHEAALNGQTDAVKILLNQGIDVNTLDQDGRTALMYAAFNGYEDIVKALLDHSADPSIQDVDGDIAETFTGNNGHIKVIELLSSAAQ